jgi:hypothetical protein
MLLNSIRRFQIYLLENKVDHPHCELRKTALSQYPIIEPFAHICWWQELTDFSIIYTSIAMGHQDKLTSSSKNLQVEQKYSPMHTPQFSHTCCTFCSRPHKEQMTCKSLNKCIRWTTNVNAGSLGRSKLKFHIPSHHCKLKCLNNLLILVYVQNVYNQPEAGSVNVC